MGNKKNILIISKRPLLREGMKLVIEENNFAVFFATSEKRALNLIEKHVPSVIVIDRPNTNDVQLDYLLRHIDYPVKIVIIGWDDEKIAIHKHYTFDKATRENLIKVITENG